MVGVVLGSNYYLQVIFSLLMILVLLLSLLMVLMRGISTIPLWVQDPLIQTNPFTIINGLGTESNTNHTKPYLRPFNATPMNLIGVNNIQINNDNYMTHYLSIALQSATSITFNVQMFTSYYVLWGIVCSIDSSLSSMIRVAYYSNSTISNSVAPNFSIIYSQTLSPPVNTLHTIHLIPFLSGIYATGYASVNVLGTIMTTTLDSSTSFSMKFHFPNYINIYSLQSYVLVVDLTSFQSTRTRYLDYYSLTLPFTLSGLWSTQVNSVLPGGYIPYVNCNNQMIGMSGIWGTYNYPAMSFLCGAGSITKNPQVTDAAFSVINFRLRRCDLVTPYYNELTNMCLDACPARYYSVPQSRYCLACPFNCLTCSDTGLLCFSCAAADFRVFINTTFVNITQAGDCECMIGYFETGASVCSVCNYTCLTCTNTSNSCTACHQYRNLTRNTCPCLTGFVDQGATIGPCMEFCGDGVRIVLACDDGANVAGDGCSSTCVIEPNYSCRQVNVTSPSTCSYNHPLVFTVSSLINNNITLTLALQITVTPVLLWMSTHNFSTMVANDSDINITSSTFSLGTISFSFVYSNLSAGNTQTITFVSPQTSTTFAIPNSSFSFDVPPLIKVIPPLPIPGYLDTTVKLLISFGVINLVVYVLGGLKLAYIQTIWTLQMSYFCLAPTLTLQPLQQTFAVLKFFASGYNEVIWEEMNTSTLSLGLQAFNYKDRFLGNLNVMLLIELSLLLLSGIFYGIGKIKQFKKGRPTLMVIHSFLLYDVTLSLVLFNILNASFATGVQIMFFLQRGLTGLFWLNILGICVSHGVSLIIFILFIMRNNQFTNNIGMFKYNKFGKYHPLVMLGVRMTMGLLMGLLFRNWFSGLLVLAVQIGYCIYISITVPYTFSFHLRAVLNEITIIQSILVGFMYYIQKIDETKEGGLVSLWIEVFLLGTTCFTSLAYLVYTVYITLSKRSKRVQIDTEEPFPADEEPMKRRNKISLDHNLISEQDDTLKIKSETNFYEGRPTRNHIVQRMKGGEY